MMKLKFTSEKGNVKGKRNNNNPVILFIIVCRDTNCFLETYPQIILPILIIAIVTPHPHSHRGISIVGKILIIDVVTNTRSAAVSISPQIRLCYLFFLQ